MKALEIVFLIVLILFISGCVQTTTLPETQIEEPQIEETREDMQPDIPENIKEKVEELVISEPAVEENKFQIFNPILTYKGAYNGPLYATSEQVGSVDMDDYFKLLDRNGINFFIGMFAISGEPLAETLKSDEGLGYAVAAAQKHPHRIIPFFNPGLGGEEVELYVGDTLTRWYTNTLKATKRVMGSDFIRGFGEVETQEWSKGHDSPEVQQLIMLAKKNNIHFMFHPVASKTDDVENILKAYPNTTFLIHLFRSDLSKEKTEWVRMLKEYDNFYFSMNAAHIIHVNGNDIIYDYDTGNDAVSKQKLLSTLNREEENIIRSAISAYKPLVDAAPEKIMWGTEMGPEYSFDPEVFDRAVKISRFVIAGFDKEHQEAVGYKNALRVFGQGVVADPNINVLDTRSWQYCNDDQISSCDDACEIPDGDILTAEQETCFQNCLIKKQCRDSVEQDGN